MNKKIILKKKSQTETQRNKMRKRGICSKGENKIKLLGVEGCNSKMEVSTLLD